MGSGAQDSRARAVFLLSALAAARLLSSCTPAPTEAPGTGGGADLGQATTVVTVTAASPETAPQGTTVDVHVLGSGFDRGSRVDFLRDGVVDPKLRVNSSTYRTGGELIANLTVAVDALPSRYDIMVTTSSGKKGIGTERFAVEVPFQQLSAPMAPAGVNDVSETGFMAGEVGTPCQRGLAPAVWDPTGRISLLPAVPGTCGGRARAVNRDGVVVGNAYFDAGGYVSARWTPGPGGYSVLKLPLLPGGTESTPYDINDAGAVGAGGAAAVWTEAGGWQMLSKPAGFDRCQTTYLNDLGQIAAACLIGSTDARIVFWPSADASPVVLPSPAGATAAWPWGINSAGVIAGYTDGAVQQAVRWVPSGNGWTVERLADLGNGGMALGLNDAGYIVGQAINKNGTGRPVFWTPGGSLRELQSVRLDGKAYGISDGANGLMIGGSVRTGKSVSDLIAVRWRP